MSLLILGGTAEARELAGALAGVAGVRLALAGDTRRPARQPVPVRVGGFGGAEGLAAYLRNAGIAAVLDATHPFAVRITANARAASDAVGVPYRQFLRPAWVPWPGESWRPVPDAASAVAVLPEAAVVLWAAGRKALSRAGPFGARRLLVRVAELPDLRQAGLRYLVARPPFALPLEIALIRRERVSHLVAKNAGGAVGRTKLEAARREGVQVIMIDRPVPLEDRVLDSQEAALAWVRGGAPA